MISEEAVRATTQSIIETYHPDMIIIFGSYARGDINQQSDLDIIVVSDKEKHLPRYKRGLETRLALPDLDIPKDILFYTHEDVEKWKNVPQSFVNTVFREGKIVYENK